jgi:hypothetical protein
MHRARNTLLSLGATIAATKLAKLVSSLELDEVLRPVGLARRQRRWPSHLALLGAGVFVGGLAALLLAPASGAQTRARVAKRASERGAGALQRARELRDELRGEMRAFDATAGDAAANRHEAT